MPFTLAHPAAVLPFTRTKLVFSALIAGALAPDIGYFIIFSSQHAESHSLTELFLICLPAGLLMLLVFHKLMKTPLLALLPATHQERLYPYAQGFHFWPASRFGLIVISLLIGSLSHLVWDSFTHKTGWMVQRVAALEGTLPPFHHYPAYKFLQHSSGVLGLAILVIAYHRWYRLAKSSAVTRPRMTSATRLTIAFVMLAGASLAALLRTVSPLISWETIRENTVQATIAFVSIFALEAIVFSVFWHLVGNRQERIRS
jgi:uncharacterized membrane protein YjfL (UPF0719 family)